MTVTIQKGLPIPVARGRGGTKMGSALDQYPFKEMEVTDSFFIEDVKKARSIMAYAGHRFKKSGRVFTSRTLTEDGKKGLRVWRIR